MTLYYVPSKKWDATKPCTNFTVKKKRPKKGPYFSVDDSLLRGTITINGNAGAK